MQEEDCVGYDGGAVQEWHRTARQIRVAPNVVAIPASAFRDCGNLTVVDLGNIGGWAFAHSLSLRKIDLSNTTKVEKGAFFDCEVLTSVSIPSSVAEIGVGAFEHCKNLMEVKLCEGIQRIGENAFFECESLVRISIPPSMISIESGAFCKCGSLLEVELKGGLQSIGANAFNDCASLQSIDIPSSTTNVGSGAFMGCNQLQSVELQEGLQVIRNEAFSDCSSLERIAIPSSVKSVGEYAFQDCRNLAEVTLREGVHDIEEDAFEGCYTLERISIPLAAFVIDMVRSSCHLMSETMPVPDNRTLVASKWIQFWSPGQLDQADARVNEILYRPQQTEDEKIQCIRKWFAYYDLLDVTTMLELAIWRCNNRNERDMESRQRIRRQCGGDMNVIIPGVLPFLGG
ncbi:hypothetical protein ACHAXT_010510 [Thalassiosira profunda]